MNDLAVTPKNNFFHFLKLSYFDVLQNFNLYLPSYIAFLLINFIASIPWTGMGYEDKSLPEILITIFVGLSSLIIIVNVILIEKGRVKNREKEKLLYAAPTYLIYTLYSSLMILAGGLCFIVPGVLVAIVVAMVPLASVLIDNDSVNYFKLSYKMAKKDIVMILCFGLVSVGIELPGFAFDFIPEWRIELLFNLLYSFFDAFLMIVLTQTSVRVFYHLKRRLNDPS